LSLSLFWTKQRRKKEQGRKGKERRRTEGVVRGNKKVRERCGFFEERNVR
jgi:hypothetical protein